MNMLRYLVTIVTVSGLGHGLFVRWALRVFPRLSAKKRMLKRIAVALTLSPILARMATHTIESELAHTVQTTLSSETRRADRTMPGSKVSLVGTVGSS